MAWKWKDIFWENILFLVLTHAFAALGIVYIVLVRFSWATVGLSVAWFFLCALSISAGYHRLFSHRAYKAAWPVRLFHILFGAASFQASVLHWASDHRDHHADTDGKRDPYDITRGFWWAHWGWICWRRTSAHEENAKDLMKDPFVSFQHRHYLALGFTMGMLVPMLAALAWNDPVGGLLMAGFVRLTLQYHASFAINSAAHTFGTQPYSRANSARDSLTAAILTCGEGYHNYHHRFPSDYRNGVRFHHFDPSKWFIWILSKTGLAWDLHRVPEESIRKAMAEAADRG